jgi:hypothetical protein
MVHDHPSELAIDKEDIQLIRDALTSHVANEDVIYEIFKRVMNSGDVEAPPSENDIKACARCVEAERLRQSKSYSTCTTTPASARS